MALSRGIEIHVEDRTVSNTAESFVDRLCQITANRLSIPRPAIHVSSTALPVGSGLGSSGALSVAIAYALSGLAQASMEPDAILRLACQSERDTGLTGGTQDQLASIHGGLGMVRRYNDFGTRSPIAADLATLGEQLVLVHGVGSRYSGSILDNIIRERPRSTVTRIIESINRLSAPVASSLSASDYTQFASLINEAHELLRSLHPDIVGDGINAWLRSLGAEAAKPCGAGGPGAVWVTVVHPSKRTTFLTNISETDWTVLDASPSASGLVELTSTAPAAADDGPTPRAARGANPPPS
ncbi:hypothetical protein ACIA5C_19485 [Actinoplanes sp. NPDC051343]|uniref:GHMP family kinase ATP-binding protein n=1 Tax=Actinoplanes sp. NPDC051343 TaxID=3363906 RepID=UPI0037B91CF6